MLTFVYVTGCMIIMSVISCREQYPVPAQLNPNRSKRTPGPARLVGACVGTRVVRPTYVGELVGADVLLWPVYIYIYIYISQKPYLWGVQFMSSGDSSYACTQICKHAHCPHHTRKCKLVGSNRGAWCDHEEVRATLSRPWRSTHQHSGNELLCMARIGYIYIYSIYIYIVYIYIYIYIIPTLD